MVVRLLNYLISKPHSKSLFCMKDLLAGRGYKKLHKSFSFKVPSKTLKNLAFAKGRDPGTSVPSRREPVRSER